MAEHSDVEWGLSCNNKKNEKGVLVTNYNESHVIPDDNILGEGYDTLFHSHPNGNPPNEYDQEVNERLHNRVNQEKYDYKEMYVYNPSIGSYILVPRRN